jgi:hypothetical protein
MVRLGGFEEVVEYGISGRRVTTSPVAWRSRLFLQRHRLGRTYSRTADKRVLRRCRANQNERSCRGIFLTGHVVSFGAGRGYTGEGRARRGLKHDRGRMRRVEGENWRERVVGKAAGDERVFVPG